MDNITLFDQNGNEVVLKLNNVKKAYVVEEILDVHCKVYSDVPYSISINSEKEISKVSVYINGEATDAEYKLGIVEFYGESRFPFAGIIGLAQISLYITYEDLESEWKYAEYASVLIKPSDTNKSLDSMLKYVYENQEDILYHDVSVTGVGREFNQSYDDFWSQIVLLEEIANVYENSYGYFMANCRTKLEKVDVLDRVEKLQEVDSRTLQYITQHPEYLQNSIRGIKYGRQYFLPSKTLMTQKCITNDIYENQVVISFLEHVLDEISSLSERVKTYLQLIKMENETENGYIISSYILYVNAKDTLKEFLEKIVDLEKQYQKLVMSYARILNVKRIPMIKRPEPTSIFINLPQYNRIYTCILRWFGKKGYDLQKERVMLSFMNAPSIYESYVLIKLINQIKDFGYTLDTAKVVNYPKQPMWMYKNQKYNNTFIFTNEHSKITLYYEPIVYDEDRSGVNGIAIYRNNSVSLNHDTEEERQGHYYVPDYILKYESDEKEKYIICDAKFSRRSKVQYQLMPELIYKYITSMSTIGEDASIDGMFIIYGLNEENSNVASFYDRHIKTAKSISPSIEMLPLSENISYSEQTDNSIMMLNLLTN